MQKDARKLIRCTGRTESRPEIYSGIVDALRRVIRCDSAAILKSDKGRLRFVAWDGVSDQYRESFQTHPPWSSNPTQPVLIPATDSFTFDATLRDAIQKEGIRALAFIPLLCQDESPGGLIIHYYTPHEFTDAEIQFAQSIAGLAAFSIERDQMEEALRRSEERHRLLVEQVRDYAIFRIDCEGRPTSWNEGVQRILGFSEAEFIGADITQSIFTPEDIAAGVPEKELETAARTGTANNDRWLRRKDGQPFWAEGTTTGLRDNAGKLTGFSKVLRDMTLRKRIEEALAQSEERYRSLFNSIDEGFCVIEVVFEENGRPVDYRFLEVNAAFEKQTGLKNAVGKTIRELAPEHEQRWFDIYGHVARTREPIRFHSPAKALGKWYDVYAFSVGPLESSKLGVLFNDVTGKKRAEEALRESEYHQRRLARHASLRADVAAALGGPRLTVREILQSCTESITRHLPAAFARIWIINQDTETLELHASAGMYTHIDGPHARIPVGKFKIGRIARDAKPHLTNDVLHDPHISNPEWAREQGMVAFAGYPLVSDGRVLGVIAMFAKEPLSEDALTALSGIADLVAQGIQRRRAEEDLAKAHAQLGRHAQQLEQRVHERTASLNESLKALETLLYTIAHDLRAPNRAMQGYASLLMASSSEKLDEQGQFFLRRISEAAIKNEALIRDLLEFGRLMHSHFPCTPVDPSEAIASVVRGFELEIRTKKATVDVAPDWPSVWANQSALNHVFANLISNALKFIPPDTPPKIRIYARELPEHADATQLCVTDNGIGIPLEQQEKVFEPFQRASNASHEGTGMGLAIVRKAAERMGGRAGVDSEPGQGSTFWVELKKAST